MHVHRSNRTERLVDALAEVVARPLRRVTEPETIVVQSKGMERWLAMELASRLGVWGNPAFPFPRAVIGRVVDTVLGRGDGAAAAFEPEAMTWSIAASLPRFRGHPAFAPIDRYLADDAGASMRVQLAERLARAFDQYVVYRPEMVLGWEEGEGDDFQAVLFRGLVEAHGSHHVARRVAACIERLGDPHLELSGIPTRLSLFGVASLPPLFLDLFAALASRVDVHLFLLSPSREYWADIRSPRERAVARRRRGERGPQEEALHYEEGNALLSSLGRLGREMQEILEERVSYSESGEDLYEDPGQGSALRTLQSDVLRLVRRGGADGPPPVLLRDGDDSLVVHRCHGPMREVEVLRDRLTELLEDSSLHPRDIVVMTPDIEAYAPLVEAVFDRARIPYRIADRGLLATHAVVDAFFAALATLSGRLGASEVLDLLGAEAVRRRFGIDASELEEIEGWVRSAGVRWGVDEAHRRAEGLPPSEQGTWRFGLDRLLLGYAMASDGGRLFADLAPCDAAAGGATELLGRFVDFAETLFAFRERVGGAHPLPEWQATLSELLEALVGDPDGDAHERQLVRAGLAELVDVARAAGFEDAVELPTVVRHLREALGHRLPAHGFLAGGVTFCQLVPMRSIPFQVVCILGLSDTAFPRMGARLGFDLVAQHPRPGDRSPRDDDRHLFLEALLSARRALHLSYVGQSLHGHRELPPSVVVGELLDEARRSFVLPEGSPHASVEERLTLPHPLAPWSPRYFGAGGDPRLFSYSAQRARGAAAVTGARAEPRPFLRAPLPPAPELVAEITLDALARFVEHPIRAFLAERLQLRLEEREERADDRLPTGLGPLEAWKVGELLVRRLGEGRSEEEARRELRASGALPLGTPGELGFRDTVAPARAIAEAYARHAAGAAHAPLAVDLTLEGVRVTGAIRDLHGEARVTHGFGKVGGGAELRAWVVHLVLNHLAGPDGPRRTVLVGRHPERGAAMVVRFDAVPEASALLADLVRLYRDGRSFPLPFVAKVSRAYVETLSAKRDPAPAERKARELFDGDERRSGAVDDPAIALAYPTYDALLAVREPCSFAEVSARVFVPLLAHREEP